MRSLLLRSSLRSRGSWVLRLAAMELRGRHRAAAGACGAFAVAALALLACLPSPSALSYGGPTPGAVAGVAGVAGVDGTAASSASLGGGGGVELVAFLREDLPPRSRETLSGALTSLAGVERVRLLGSDEALARMRSELGDRASVLDGVEEGFLPATLEVSLQRGPNGAERADAIAWRLRRMDGITDVDVLRTAEDQRSMLAEVANRRSRRLAIGLALAAGALAFCLATLGLQRRGSDAALLSALGFTAAAMAVPRAVAGALCAVSGAGLGTLLGAIAARMIARWSPGALAIGPQPGQAGWIVGGIGAFLLLGAGLGWWGARPSSREGAEIEANG